MTIDETVKVLTMMATIYPDTDKNMSREVAVMKAKVWQRIFAEEPMQVVTAALEAYMSTSTSAFAPVPGQLKEQIRKLSEKEELTEGEAWQYVAKALRNSTYNSAEEYAKLPEVVQRCVGSHEQLKEWALMDAETVASVVASNFQRGYRYRKEHENEVAKLPETVKQFIGSAAERLMIGG